ncbi:MAG: hypothetical protein N2Z70_06225 [Bdellovibrionaceae bacterium]|jgi:hypothetical protein|nr:hypothetical protein [Pseudobdellovibrionaceae bacterium]
MLNHSLKKFVLVSLVTLSSLTSFGQLLTQTIRFMGTDTQTQQNCNLTIEQIYVLASGLDVRARPAYSHNSVFPGVFRVINNGPSTLRGTTFPSSSASELILFFHGTPHQSLSNLTAYQLNWWHGNHWHHQRCQSLKRLP